MGQQAGCRPGANQTCPAQSPTNRAGTRSIEKQNEGEQGRRGNGKTITLDIARV